MNLDDIPLALTYDDVLLVPQRSDIRSRSQVSIASQLTNTIAMDTPCLLYTSPSPRDKRQSRMPSSA